MKKNKIIGFGVASIGLIISAGSAFALYKTNAHDTGFGIGAGTYHGAEGVVTYKINNAVNGTITPQYWNQAGTDITGTGLSPTFTQVAYEGTLSATFADNLNQQDYVLGKLSIQLDNISQEYRNHLSVWVDIDGYEADSLGEQQYNHVFMNNDYEITSEQTSYSDSKTVAVAAAGVQKLRVILKFDLGSYDVVAKNEASLSYELSITWGEADANFEKAYVLSNITQWQFDDAYSMVPNIGKPAAQGWEWVYNNLPGSFGDSKCAKPGQGNEKVFSKGENEQLIVNEVYDVYWSGSAEDSALFSAQGQQQQNPEP